MEIKDLNNCGCGADESRPYLYCKACFYQKIDELKPKGACSSQKYNGKIDYALVSHLERVSRMSFGVHEWLYKKAMVGCSESLWKINYGYVLFDEVRAKAIEDGLI